MTSFFETMVEIKMTIFCCVFDEKNYDFLLKIRVFGLKLRHDCINFIEKHVFAQKY